MPFFDGVGGIFFCSGTTTTDIAAHEYTHALTYFAVKDGYGNPFGLNYENDAGALNEAFSDIFGEAIEHYATGNGDWLSGTGSVFGVLRDMSSPARAPFYQPDRAYSPYMYCCSGAEPADRNDYCGVHTNSGVLNKAAWLMAMGGSFNGCQVGAIGREAEERILYQALTRYLTINSTFKEAFDAIQAACEELYPGSPTCIEVSKALYAVELNQGGRCSGEQRQDPAAACAALGGSTSTPTPTPTATQTPVNTQPPATPTPTVIPTLPPPTAVPIAPEFSISAGAGKSRKQRSVAGGKPVYLFINRSISSGAFEDKALLFASVDGKICNTHFELSVSDAGVGLTTKFPKLPKKARVTFLSGNQSAVTGTAKITVNAEKVWRSRTKSVKAVKICTSFAENLR